MKGKILGVLKNHTFTVGLAIALFVVPFLILRLGCSSPKNGDDESAVLEANEFIAEITKEDIKNALNKNVELEKKITELQTKIHSIEEKINEDVAEREETHVLLESAVSIDDIDRILDESCGE